MQVVLFDIDGTLISTLRAGLSAMEASLLDGFQVSERIDERQISGRTDRAIARAQFLRHAIEDSEAHFQHFIDGYLRHLPRALGASQGRILPGVATILETLSARNDVEVGLLTGNVPGGAKIKLSHFGIYHYFRFGGFGDRHLSRDDVARDARQAIDARWSADVAPDNIFVIGDTPFDIACARAIGARAIAVATGVHTAEQLAEASPDLLIDDLTDTRSFLSALGDFAS